MWRTCARRRWPRGCKRRYAGRARQPQYLKKAYKLRILERAERCGEGELGGLLRREGLYYSHLTAWRGQRERGVLAGLEPKKRGPKPARKDPRDETIRQLAREVSRLEKKLEQAKTIIDVQKKVSRLLGITLDQPDEENS